MDFHKLRVLLLHQHPEYLKPCCDLINEEWSRSQTARMMSLQASCDELPTSLILVNENNLILGHCKLSRIPSIPDSCFLETVVISKKLRGRKLGTFLMTKVEEYCLDVLRLKKIHLSTKGQENFYSKLGYKICPPVSIYGSSLPNIGTSVVFIHIEGKSPEKPGPIVLKGNAPLPPPMPVFESNNNLTVLKSSKTYMFKHL